MKSINGVLCAIILMLSSTAVFATREGSGAELLYFCEAVEAHMDRPPLKDILEAGEGGYCVGWTESYLINIQAFGGKIPAMKACLPKEGLDVFDGVRILIKYLENHPNRLNESASVLTLDAFKEAFPCE